MGKLRTTVIKNYKPELKETRLSDGQGLFLRVRPSGAKSWLYYFRLPNSRALHQITLGAFPDISLEEARQTLPELRRQIKQGLDPRQVRAAKQVVNTQAVTMQSLFESWIEFLKNTESVAQKWIKAHTGRWNNHLKPSLGNILAKDITRAHLARALDNMSAKGIREETRKALTALNLILDYGLTRHMIDHNPARILKPKDFAASANRPRERALSLIELRKLWVALDEATKKRDIVSKTSSMSVITATAIKILILTGARRGEVAAMRWDEIDFEAGIWEIPALKTKNRQTHKVFLAPLTKKLIKSLAPITGQSPYIFDTGMNTQGHIHIDALTRALRRLIKNDNPSSINTPLLSNMKYFSTHDIRRSVSTACGEYLKIKPHVIERMLNHQPIDKLIRTYQRATYSEEQKDAWLTWGELIESQIANEPNNIVPIRKSANY